MDLQNIDVKLDDENLAIYLLCSLPPSYKHFRETLLYGRKNLSSDDIKNALTQRDLIDTQLSSKSSSTSNDGLYVRVRANDKGSTYGSGSKGKSRSKSRSSNKNKTCNYCKLKGHIKKDCWKWKKKHSNNEERSKEGSSRVEASYANDSDDGGVLVATHEYKGENE